MKRTATPSMQTSKTQLKTHSRNLIKQPPCTAAEPGGEPTRGTSLAVQTPARSHETLSEDDIYSTEQADSLTRARGLS